jgi:hypothetical protein
MCRSLVGGLVLALSLALAPPSAQATCAWVAWFRTIDYPKNIYPEQRGRWNLGHAYPTADECGRDIRLGVAMLSIDRPGAKVTASSVRSNSSGLVVIEHATGSTQHEWACLPDTQNPNTDKHSPLPPPHGRGRHIMSATDGTTHTERHDRWTRSLPH